MTGVSRFDNITLGVALGLPCVTSLWLMFWAPRALAASTFAVAATLLLTTAAVVITTWKNAQATGSVAQLRYETDTDGRPGRRKVTSRWERWLKRYDQSAARGRSLALLGLGVIVTAVIVNAWLSS